MATISELRPSPIAGVWYSGDREKLRRQIDGYLAQADLPQLEGTPVAIVAPHAGHRYSGRTAGYAFRSVQGLQPDLVVIISPFHSYSSAALMTTAHQAYQTPLGPIWIDQEAVAALNEALLGGGGPGLSAIANDKEHSLEIELPFLQCSLAAPFKLLPVMMRSQSSDTAHRLGLALASVLRGRSALLVASSDLSHFFPEVTANQLDHEMLHQIECFSPEGVLKSEQEGTGLACGAYPIAAVLWAAHELGADSAQVLHHSTSGDETGDHDSVVGYGAAVILKRP